MMGIRTTKALPLFLVVAFVTLPGWGQNSNQKGSPVQSGAGAAKPADAGLSPGTNPNPNDISEFVIGSEDSLMINVWKEPEVSRAVLVRSDGKITLPLIGEIQAAGKTPKQLQAEIAKGLGSYISDPEVSVIVQTSGSKKYSILGKVNRAGSVPLGGPTTILDAIAAAGGLQDFAKRKKIYILRTGPDGREQRIRFNYVEVTKGKHPEQNILLQSRDIIFVP
jgi:polysaccharide biosynthesis/export protein